MRAVRSRRRPSPLYTHFHFFLSHITPYHAQPAIRGASTPPFYGPLWHIVPLRPTKKPGEGSRQSFQGPQWHIVPLRKFRVAAIRPVWAGGTSLITEVRAFRHTAARAPALEGVTGHISAEFGVRLAQIRGSLTATLVVAPRKGLPVRLFGGNPSDFHGIGQVSPNIPIKCGGKICCTGSLSPKPISERIQSIPFPGIPAGRSRCRSS